MTPGIHPSNVKMRLRKKLAIRPVRSTARGGQTNQKKYRSAFMLSSRQIYEHNARPTTMFSVEKLLPKHSPGRYLSPSMDSPPAASLPPQVPDGAIGWFAKSCLTLIIAAVALVIICLFGRWFILTRFADRFTATQPAVVEVQQPTAP